MFDVLFLQNPPYLPMLVTSLAAVSRLVLFLTGKAALSLSSAKVENHRRFSPVNRSIHFDKSLDNYQASHKLNPYRANS